MCVKCEGYGKGYGIKIYPQTDNVQKRGNAKEKQADDNNAKV